MPPGIERPASNIWRFRIALTLALVIMVAGCTTESARQTATSEAQGTPETTITPAGNLLMINDEIVQSVYIPDPQLAALYAMTSERLYVWENREWKPTATRNTGTVLLVDHTQPEQLFRGNHPSCAQEESVEPIPFEVSEDGGETWRAMPGVENIRPLALDPVFPDVIFGTDCSLAISTDLGATWSHIQPLIGHEIIDLVVIGERILVLGVSTQGKSQVRELRLISPEDVPEISDTIVQIDGIATIDADETRLVIGAPDGVRISMDGGTNWTTVRTGLESVTESPDDQMTPNPSVQRPNRSFGVLAIELDPTRSNRIFAGTVRGLYISQDDGGTWDLYRSIDEHASVLDIQFAAGGEDIYVTTGDGVVMVPNP